MKTRGRLFLAVVGLFFGACSIPTPTLLNAEQTVALPPGKGGEKYQFQFQSEGGITPISWQLAGGELPPGLHLESSGKLQGVPTAPRREPYSFLVEAVDSSQPSQKVTQPFSLLIQAAPLKIVIPSQSAPEPLRIQTEISSSAVPEEPRTKAGTYSEENRDPGTKKGGHDARANFEASFYTGLAIDTFASGELRKLLNPIDSSGLRERAIAGFDFAYRLHGHQNSPRQLWVYGETVHGIRSTEFNCKAQANLPVCNAFDLSNSGERAIYVLRNATSLEAFLGLRWEFLTLQKESPFPAHLYLKAQAGFLNVAGGAGDVVDIHHLGLGLISTRGRYQNSYLEVGFGRTDLFNERRRRRWKIDGFLTWDLFKSERLKGIRPFAQMTVDSDLGHGSDSIQTYLGLDFDLKHFFAHLGNAQGEKPKR